MKINSQYNPYTSMQMPKQNGAISRYGITSPSFGKKDVITYKDAQIAIKNINSILGKNGYMQTILDKAGIAQNANEINIISPKIHQALWSTLKYPFTDMPFELAGWFAKGIKKIKPIQAVGDAILNNNFLKTKLNKIDSKKSYEFVSKILEQYYENQKLYGGNIDKLSNQFIQNSANKITKTAKAYASRDERTLNRIVTGGIGAILSSFDMYNISMLEKNDKKSAKEAEKSRRDQELTRVFMSAGLTFLTLGIFDKFAKGNYVASSIIIAGSTLLSEIVSRVIKHKPLVPISPERAQKIAQKNESKKPKEKLSFTKIALNRTYKNDKTNLFKNIINFSSDDDTYNSLVKPHLGEVKIDNSNKKNKHIGLKIAAAAILCNLIYLIAYKQKGESANMKLRNQLFEEIKKITQSADTIEAEELISKLTNGGDISNIDKNLLDRIIKASKSKDDFLTIIKKAITKTKLKVNTENLQKEIDKILSMSDKEDIKGIKPILEKYKKELDFIGQKEFTQKVKRPVIGALYEGFTKIFDILYMILSMPAWGLTKLMGMPYKKSEKVFEGLNKLLDTQDKGRLTGQYKQQLAELNKIFKKYENNPNKYDKIADTLNTHTHNFERSAETSDLASLSRTLVTLLSSYFYVNDFRNTVLIESEGKNIERAQEVMNDSISFKVCNFFFNGTLMNLFNSVFKTILNGSLLGATAVAAATEVTNEFLIRKTISRPMKKLDSRDEIVEFERSQANRRGFAGWWTRNFKKLTGQKSLVEKYEAKQLKKK